MSENIYDMIIVGGGPAGLSAAIYMARAKYKTLLIEKEKFGGQITITEEIVNYPGIYKTSGEKLTSDMQRQAESFGAEFKLCDVLDIDTEDDIKTIKTSIGEFKTLGVILALGASPRKLGFPGESDFAGRGVAYCATCDGEFFTDMPIYVVGGGFAAVEEGIFLTKYGSSVKMLVREENFTCAQTIYEEVAHNDKIEVLFNTEVVSVEGENALNSITYKNNLTGETVTDSHKNGFGVFIFAGYLPNTGWIKDKIATENGYIITDINQKTNVCGIYAAGDVCIKELRQVVTAVSDGATAATAAEKYVAALHTKLNLPAFEVSGKPKPAAKKESIAKTADEDSFITEEMRDQLAGIFEKFESVVTVNAVVDNSELAGEMRGFIGELTGISDKVLAKISDAEDGEAAPCLEILRADGSSSGIRFFTMPGGHEFNSFILSLYNVAGPGREVSDEDRNAAAKIDKATDIKVLISLSCTMCPEVVVSSGRIASLNENVTASAYDIAHFPELKEKYNVMSVPCMVINDTAVHFGKKNVTQILELI